MAASGSCWRTGTGGLSGIKCGEHSPAAALASDSCFGRKVVGAAANTTRGNAPVIVTDDNATFFVDRHIKEIEQVAAGSATADAAALDRIARRNVLSAPGHAAIKRRSDIEKPNTGE